MVIEQVKILLERPKQNYNAAISIINATLTELEAQDSALHHQELTFYRSLRYDDRKLSYLSGRIAAKQAVSILTGTYNLSSISIHSGVFHQPVVNVPLISGIQVSISHCKTLGLAIAFPEEHPMGIDVEEIDETKLDALKSVTSEKEMRCINSCTLSVLTGATIIWSAKESLAKILKTGFTTDPSVFEIDTLTPIGTYYICTFTNFTQYKVYIDICCQYLYSIALPLNTNIELKEFSTLFQRAVQSSFIV